MNLLPPTWRRIIALLGLGVAFVVMASVFVPGDGRAQEDLRLFSEPRSADSALSETPDSTDPHVDLPAIGSLEHGKYLIFIYATDVGPRYTVYDRRTREELGTLLNEDQIEQHFPELPIRDMGGENTQLMMVRPDFNRLPY